jgi:aminoglycoside/choline kinase family phosphotransferase
MGCFGEALLQRDAGLFDEWFLQRHLGLQLDCGELEGLELVHRRLMDNALGQPQVLTHRDFMPRNLMPVDDGPAVLDFQDLVRGPIAYDPVSLFKDAFLSWPLARVDAWLARYHAQARAAGLPVLPWPQFLRDADWMGVQRHLKILGLFVRLRDRDGKGHYFDDAPRFIRYLDEVLPRHPELAPLRALLEDRIKPALARLAQPRPARA